MVCDFLAELDHFSLRLHCLAIPASLRNGILWPISCVRRQACRGVAILRHFPQFQPVLRPRISRVSGSNGQHTFYSGRRGNATSTKTANGGTRDSARRGSRRGILGKGCLSFLRRYLSSGALPGLFREKDVVANSSYCNRSQPRPYSALHSRDFMVLWTIHSRRVGIAELCISCESPAPLDELAGRPSAIWHSHPSHAKASNRPASIRLR